MFNTLSSLTLFLRRILNLLLPHGTKRRSALYPRLRSIHRSALAVYYPFKNKALRIINYTVKGEGWVSGFEPGKKKFINEHLRLTEKVLQNCRDHGSLPTISIVSVIYNKEKEVTYFLESLFRQTYQGSFEIILVDDCTSDNSIAVVKQYLEEVKAQGKFRYTPEVHIVKNDSNIGNCHSRNKGVSCAQGDIVVIMDADCIVNRDFILEHAAAHRLDDCDVVIGPHNIETNGEDPFTVLEKYADAPEKVLIDCQLQDDQNICSFLNCITRNFSIKKRVIDGNLFDPLFSYSKDPLSGFGWEDVEMGYDLYKKGTRIKFIPNAYSIHISHESTVDEETKAVRSLLNFRRLFEKHPELLLVARRWTLGTYQKILKWIEKGNHKESDERRFLDNHFQRFLPYPFYINSKRGVRILTYRWHCSHQYELYKLPCEFTLATGVGTGFTNSWDYEQRPLRSNVSLRPIEEISIGNYDLAILHFDENVLAAENTNGVIGPDWGINFKYFRENLKIPKIAICHGTPQFYGQYTDQFIDAGDIKVIEKARQDLVAYVGDMLIICNSYQAQREWGFKNSKVIWHGFDPTEFPPAYYDKGILTPGRAMKERPHYRGYFFFQQVFKNFPEEYAPEHLPIPNPHFLYERDTNPYAHTKFKNYVNDIRKYSIYFNPTIRSPMPRSRGEAMICGLVTVSANNHDVELFIKNGVNGYYSSDHEECKEYLLYLMKNPEVARKVGQAGRLLAMDLFNNDRYLKEWEDTISDLLV
ncbi:MAG TPA: glycosyltransferase [Candidatus Brocadiaceae bacterium]